jgi:hypothetical protein
VLLLLRGLVGSLVLARKRVAMGAAMSQILSVLLFVVAGLAILAAAVWYITTLYDVFVGEKSAVLGEIKVLGRTENEAKSIETGLPRLIVAELRRQRDELNTAISELRNTHLDPIDRIQRQVVSPFSTDIIRLFNKTVYPDLKIGGVDATGLVKFLSDQLPAGDVLSISVSYSAKSQADPERTLVYGHQIGARGYSFVTSVPKHGIDDVAGAVAASIMAHEVRRIEGAFETLSGKEFEHLLAVLKRYADLVRRGAFASIGPAEYQDVLTELDPLARKYNRWEGLQRLLLKIADQADEKDRGLAAARALEGILLRRLAEKVSEPDRSKIRSELTGLQAKFRFAEDTASTAQPPGDIVKFCGTGRDKRLDEAYRPILATIGVRTHHSTKGIKIAVAGGVPSRAVLDQISHEIVGPASVPLDTVLSSYLAGLVSVACQVTPDVTFVFASMDAASASSLMESSLLDNVLHLLEANPDVLLFAYGGQSNDEQGNYMKAFARLAKQNVVLVTSAGNQDGALPAVYLKENAAGLRAAATDPLGDRPSIFSRRDAEVVWAPGENLLIVEQRGGSGNLQLNVSSGTAWSAALVAASAALLRSEVREATPAQVRKAFFDTSRRRGGDVALIDVEAAIVALRPKPSK